MASTETEVMLLRTKVEKHFSALELYLWIIAALLLSAVISLITITIYLSRIANELKH